MQKGIRLNDGHKDGTRRGALSKKSSDNTKWHTKWFALLQNMLFYFENESSSRPSGLYLLEGCKALELRTEDVKDCDEWVASISHASFRNLATEHESLMQKYLHLLQIVETEKTVAKQLRQQIEDGEIEIERLKSEISGLLKDNEKINSSPPAAPSDEDSEIKKIKKVQSFLRGWICRRKWKTIIQDYIRSPHAESMRKRNQVVFSMLDSEAEYVQQLHILVNNFLRPLRMAASSKKPPITHDDVSSIFLNSETIMFLHQIFYQGLKARIASWPTLVLADLFDILLPMLNIYQEFVRNHQYSLQILAHCKQNRDFDKLLKQYEAKPDCEERTLETFLTYPITSRGPVWTTPSLNWRSSPGSLIQVPMSEKGKITRGRLGSLSLKKEGERQCFLFSKHIIICTRGSGGKLHLSKTGVVSLIDCTLLEDPEGTEDEPKTDKSGQDLEHLDFKIVVEPKDLQSFTVILMIKSDSSLYCDDVDIRFSKMMNSCKVLQIRYASVERLLERLTDLRFLSIDFLNTFLHSYRVFTGAHVLFFASSQNNKLLYGEPPKSPRASRKFSSPPPLAMAKNSSSSPNRRRKLSLNIPIITGGKALDLAALSCSSSSSSSSNGYASMYSTMSPFSKTTLDINKLYVSSPVGGSKTAADEGGDGKTDKPEDTPASKQDLSVREESDNEQNLSDEADPDTSPIKSPTTPKNVRCKNSSEFSLFSYNNGMVMSSCRELDSNRSALSAASAFAIATAGANEGTPTKEKYRRMSIASTGTHAAYRTTVDFENNNELKSKAITFLEEVMHDPELLTQERKAAANIIRTLTQEDPGDNQISLEEVIRLTEDGGKAEPFENLSALEIAEQLTLLDHLVFKVIPYEEFFGQGWMKNDKNEKTPEVGGGGRHLPLSAQLQRRPGDHLLLNRSSVFRLKKTWLKVSKQTKAVIDKLQKLVSSEGRFKNLREALKNCDPPCVPYLGMYLTDLAFIEEGTPNYTEDNLVNFSKMRMISHIIREIRQFQQTAYKIDHQPKAAQYLLDKSSVLDEESMYEASLGIEPKVSN
ncbi:hypothetical protein CRUP_006146 [Coryphaenoides rupestris]|nr:hypothetical protein CRUP_006146 [Coryphaenoides rupestris]